MSNFDPFSQDPFGETQSAPAAQEAAPAAEATNVGDETVVTETPQAPAEKTGSDLAGAPEVGITSAKTEPGSKQRKTERDKAQGNLDRAKARLERAEKRRNKAGEQLAKFQSQYVELDAQVQAQSRLVEHLSSHPALSDED